LLRTIGLDFADYIVTSGTQVCRKLTRNAIGCSDTNEVHEVFKRNWILKIQTSAAKWQDAIRIMVNRYKVLIVEDSESLAAIFSRYLGDECYEIRISTMLDEARRDRVEFAPEFVLLDLQLPDGNRLALLSAPELIKQAVDIIVMTAFGSNGTAARALRTGATDYLSEPFDAVRLNTTVTNLIQRRDLSNQVAGYAQLNREGDCDFIGATIPIQSVYRIIESVAPSKATAFIIGESGTDKALIAGAIHPMSDRKGAFHAIDCRAGAHDIMESAIFGHVNGAFTGSTNNPEGVAGAAGNGLLFLDEIGEMDLALQNKMLRFRLAGEFSKVGSNVTERVDVRLICATNQRPQDKVRTGRFPEDLYCRLHVVPIELPPLSQRGQDILLLANRFLQMCSLNENKQCEVFSTAAAEELLPYSLSGNGRELQNVVQHAVVLNNGKVVQAAMLSMTTSQNCGAHRSVVGHSLSAGFSAQAGQRGQTDQWEIEPLWFVERSAIESAINKCAGDVHKAADCLKVVPSILYRTLQSWRVSANQSRGAA
jgi:two-component system repressor protein LuxO